jgi:hypothetical protein
MVPPKCFGEVVVGEVWCDAVIAVISKRNVVNA